MNNRAIALDLGGTLVKAGIVNNQGFAAQKRFESGSGKGFKDLLSKVENEVRVLLDSEGSCAGDIDGIGISIPGIVDSKQKKMLSVNEKYSEAENYDFKKWAKECFGLNLEIDNDSRCALLGERKYGAGRGYDNIVMVTLGTGVGGAAMIEGQLLKGRHFQAGILGGHFVIDYHGNLCNCGNRGCVESVASTWRLPSLVREQESFEKSILYGREQLDFKTLFEAHRKGDKLANKLVDQCLEAWSAGVITMIHAYDPEIVVMGGGIMESSDIILPFIRENVGRHAWIPWGKVKIVKAEHGGWSSTLGAGLLVLENENL